MPNDAVDTVRAVMTAAANAPLVKTLLAVRLDCPIALGLSTASPFDDGAAEVLIRTAASPPKAAAIKRIPFSVRFVNISQQLRVFMAVEQILR
jgi:hypothetical protein